MTAEDNVVKMPDLLERRAQRIEAALDRQDDANDRSDKADADWKAATLDLAIELAGAKADLNNSNNRFGEWCDKRFGDNRLNENDRAALVRWGADPEGTRKMLANDDSRSVQHIDRRFGHLTKTTSSAPSPKPVGGPRMEDILAFGLAYEAEHERLPTENEITTATGCSTSTAHTGAAVLRTARSNPLNLLKFTRAQDAHVEARVKVRLRELEREFENRVVVENKKQIDILFPGLEKMREDAKRNERFYREQIEKRAIFTDAEYRDILLCTHEGNPSEETRKRAFIALNAKKLQLTGKL